jgi:hypothetical protein
VVKAVEVPSLILTGVGWVSIVITGQFIVNVASLDIALP